MYTSSLYYESTIKRTSSISVSVQSGTNTLFSDSIIPYHNKYLSKSDLDCNLASSFVFYLYATLGRIVRISVLLPVVLGITVEMLVM